MVHRIFGCGLAAALASGALGACGGGGAAGTDTSSTTDDASVYGSSFFGDAGQSCKTDADCPSGQTCRTVRVGELTSDMCIVDPTAADASPPADGGLGIDANFDAGVVISGFDSGTPYDASALFADASADGGLCNKTLTVTGFTSGPIPSCYFDTDVTAASSAELTYTCAGGPAAVTFGTETFTGTVTGTTVNVTNVITYDFQVVSIKCNITSTQTITGDLASGTVTYKLQQALSPNQPALCSALLVMCYKNGSMSVK